MKKTNINFIGNRKIAMTFSGILMVIAIISLAVKGLQMGIDFTGGTLIEVGYEQAADLSVLRKTLDESGFKNATVQNFGTAKDVLIRLKLEEGVNSADLSTKVLEAINKNAATPAKLRRVEFVGPCCIQQ
jgi:preprotein translocase subunit SecF